MLRRVPSLTAARRAYADRIGELAELRTQGLARGLASVPREDFLGPGPWRILQLPARDPDYVLTPDADPRHLYANVLIALDRSRNLNNGEPAALLRWLDQLELAPGRRFLHLGCGTGYYTAIAACATDPGEILAIELDPELAARARRNLARWPQVRVECGDGRALAQEAFDAILVNAGATELRGGWLDALRNGGRLLIPLTVDLPLAGVGAGQMLLVARDAERFRARFTSPVAIFHCAGARSAEGNDALRRACRRGDPLRVRSLRRDPHAPSPGCWLHAGGACLAYGD